MTVPNRSQFSFNLGTNRNQTAFCPWCMFLLLWTPCGDSIKQVSPSNRQHSLKSIQLVQLSETMNLLLTSAFLFGMGWESDDKSIEKTGTVALIREGWSVMLTHWMFLQKETITDWHSYCHTPGYFVYYSAILELAATQRFPTGATPSVWSLVECKMGKISQYKHFSQIQFIQTFKSWENHRLGNSAY